MKRILLFALFIILTVFAVFSVSSCGDDDFVVHTLYLFDTKDDPTFAGYYRTIDVSEGQISYEPGDEAEHILDVCQRYGFVFEGLFSEPKGEGELYMDKDGIVMKRFTDASDSMNEIRLYACYTAIKQTITLSHNDNLSSFEFDYYSEGAALPSVTAPDNYDHIGWRVVGEDYTFTTLPSSVINVFYDGSLEYNSAPTLEAVYRGTKKTVTLNSADGNMSSDSLTVYYNEPYTLPVPTAPEGRIFSGWSYNGIRITDRYGNSLSNYSYAHGIDLRAEYGNLVTVSFDVFSDESFTQSSCELPERESAVYKAPALVGYQFDRIDISSSDGSVSLKYDKIEDKSVSYGYDFGGIGVKCTVNNDGTRDFEITSVPFDLSVKIYFMPAVTILENVTEGAIFIGEISSVSYGEQFSLPIAYKGGYRFEGWRIAGSESAITDAEGIGLSAWEIGDRTASIEAIFVEDKNAAYVIFDRDSLLAMKNNPGGKYILLNDVTLGSESWTPFAFSGTLDGCGYTIKDVTLSADSGNLGIFTTLSGTVKNLTLENISVSSQSGTRVNVGILAATITGTAEDVSVYGSVIADNVNMGGICGTLSGGRIIRCSNYASLTTNTLEDGAAAGGIAGYIANGTVTECENHADITAFANVGGLIGYASGSNSVTKSKNYGRITAGSGFVGGCVGRISASNFGDNTVIFNNLSNGADVNAVGSRVGGVIGSCDFYGDWWETKIFVIDFHKLTNEGDIEGDSCVGGCVGYAISSTGKAAFHPQISVKLTDLVNSGDINAQSIAGGCIGYGYGLDSVSLIIRSSSSGSISVKHTGGGVAGYMDNFKIDTCENTGAVIKASSYYIENGGYYVRLGGIAGVGADIVNCNNSSDIEYGEKGCYIGGVAGVISRTVSNCTNDGDILAPKASSVGGVVGRISHSANFNISKLTNSGDVTGNESVGGVIGSFNCYFTFNDSDDHTTLISELTSSGDVYSYGGFCGGIFGKLEGEAYNHDGRVPKFKAIVSFIECSGNVTSQSPLATGALIGYASTDSDGSMLDAYSFTGKLNGEDATVDTIVGSKNKFTVVES